MFQQIQPSDYLFTEQLANIYSREEQVRQWMLRELTERYKYPMQLITVEHKVNNFSRVGSVDICISIYHGNQCLPFIFVETKAFGSGLVNGVRQMQSYLAACS